MSTNFQELFDSTKPSDIPEGLFECVMETIAKTSARSIRRAQAFWGAFTLSSLTALVFATRYAFLSFASSNFGSFFSLIFSDGSIMLSSWREFGMSLVESLPVLGLMLFFASIALVLWSLRTFVRKTSPLIINARTA